MEGLLHVGALHHGDLYVEHRTADRLHGRCQDDILSTGNWDVHWEQTYRKLHKVILSDKIVYLNVQIVAHIESLSYPPRHWLRWLRTSPCYSLLRSWRKWWSPVSGNKHWRRSEFSEWSIKISTGSLTFTMWEHKDPSMTALGNSGFWRWQLIMTGWEKAPSHLEVRHRVARHSPALVLLCRVRRRSGSSNGNKREILTETTDAKILTMRMMTESLIMSTSTVSGLFTHSQPLVARSTSPAERTGLVCQSWQEMYRNGIRTIESMEWGICYVLGGFLIKLIWLTNTAT